MAVNSEYLPKVQKPLKVDMDTKKTPQTAIFWLSPESLTCRLQSNFCGVSSYEALSNPSLTARLLSCFLMKH